MVPYNTENFWPSSATTSFSRSIQLRAGTWSVNYYGRSRVGTVGKVSGLLVGRAGNRIPLGTRDFALLQSAQTGPGTHPASYAACTEVHFQDIKRAGRTVSH